MLSIRELIPYTAPRFATRFRWALDERDRDALIALRSEDPEEYQRLLALHKANLNATSNEEAANTEQARELQRRGRAARLQQGRVAVTDEMRAAIVDGSFDMTEALRVTESWWARRETPWLILCGSSSCGKSVAAASPIAAHGGLWLTSNELVQAFSARFGEPFAMQQRAKTESLLVIDELGDEDEPALMTSALLQLLNVRNSAERTPVIATTNLTFEALAARYPNDRIRLRLNELVTWAPLAPMSLRPSRPRVFSYQETQP
jgi:DNA replication protein DnaC